MNLSIYCDNCGEPCKDKMIAGQCPECGGYICKQCLPYHLCMKRTEAEVRLMEPEYVELLTESPKY